MPRPPQSGRLIQGVALAAIGALVCVFAAGGLADPTSPLSRWLPVAVIAAATLSVAVRASTIRVGSGAWMVMAVALAAWGAGALVDAVQGRPLNAADGTGAVFRVAFYPLAYLSLVQLVRGRIHRFAAALWLDGLIGALAVAAVGVGVVIQPAIETSGGSLRDMLVRLVLPLGDLLLLAFIAGVMALNGWRPSRAWTIIGAGLGLMALTHALELTVTPTGEAHLELAALLGPVGIGLIGLSAWWPSTLSTQLRLEGWGLLVGPTLFGWLTVALVAYGNFVELGVAGLGLATLTLLLVMVRTGLTFKENITIAEELRAEVSRSTRDALTGLLTHRTFQEALAEQIDLAHEHGDELSLIMVDVDDFRLLNDRHGHEAGDEVLRILGDLLDGQLRNEDLIARIGGEEFACLLPHTGGTAAWLVAERARAAMEHAQFPGVGRVTISAGVCDLRHASNAADLWRLADGALYWAKRQGRNNVARYQPDIMDVLSVEERAAQLERDRTLSAISALARAVDAKDTSTHRHSERVGTIAGLIATRLGWTADQVRLLREAALVHDVGKIGVPDKILTKPGPLDVDEYEVMKTHAALGAQIVREVLTPDQTQWVLHHHERWDGAGYPGQLVGDEIPEGARIMAVADAWDAMTAHRVYRPAISAPAALEILRNGCGSHWWEPAIQIALRLAAEGTMVASALEDEEIDGPSAAGWAVDGNAVAAGESLAASVSDGTTDGDGIQPGIQQTVA